MLQCAFIAYCSNLGAPNPELNTAKKTSDFPIIKKAVPLNPRH
jgi:hypothetical protein